MKKILLPCLLSVLVLISCKKSSNIVDPDPLPVQVPTNGLIAFYPFNGNANDSSGNGNNGHMYNLTAVADRFGNINSAFSFSKSNSYIRVDSSSHPLGEVTVTYSFWVKLPAGGACGFEAGEVKYYQRSSFGVALKNIGYHTHFNDYETTFDTSKYLKVDQWYHCAMVKAGHKITFYVNSQLVSAGTNDTTRAQNLQKTRITIGANSAWNTSDPQWYNGEFSYGTMDDIRIYNRVLSADEIGALYHERGWTGQ